MTNKKSFKIPTKELILLWAIRRSGQSIDTLSKKQGMKNLEKWLSGETEPTIQQLEKFASVTFTPFGYLFLSNPPREHLSIPYLRTQSNEPMAEPSLNFIETVQIVEQRQDWMRELLISEGAEPLEFVGSASMTDPPKETAYKIRKELKMNQEWATNYRTWTDALSKMQDMIEDIGIFLTASGVVGYNNRRALDPEEFRGFVLIDKHAPFIFVNSKDFKAAQMFTLAHELAHVWLGKSAAFDLRHLSPASDTLEQTCNRIAAEFLVPEKELSQAWKQFTTEANPYQAGAQHFKVSEIVIARRALDTTLISVDEFFRFYQGQQSIQGTTSDGGNFYNTARIRIGKKFTDEIIAAVKGGKMLYSEAYNLTGLNRNSFDGLSEHIRSEYS